MAKAAASIPALGYLAHPSKHPARPVCAVFGDEPFLKLQVLAELRRQVLSGDDGEFSYRGFIGEEIEDPRAVFDELGTVALFGGGQRLVVVNDADPFVSDHRQTLEDYVANPRPTGVLVLEVKTWQTTTKLYKAVAEKGLSIDCKSPKADAILAWMHERAEKVHRAKLQPAAVERLLEIVGPAMGRLDQEIAKLALLASPMLKAGTPHPSPLTPHQDRSITIDLVNANVGGWQVREIWAMVGAAAAGDASTALVMLDRLVAAGEEPIALLAMLASKLRPLAAATRAYEDAERAGRRITPRQAVAESATKVWPQMLDEAERNMTQLGRQRTGQIYHWLLEADLALKSGKSKGHGSRMVLEELIVRLGKPITA
jgi:DNA polymerase-3 subunit delta